MYRSFTDRVFGGVCGGLATKLRVRPWLVRALFTVLTALSLGVFGALYLLLWWTAPQESLMSEPDGGGVPVAVVLVLAVLLLLVWIASLFGFLRGPTGVDLLVPALMLLLGVVFLLRQVRFG
jgi:phage shock protein PspC (stress-responsive transcriptional regulator)